MSLNLVKIGFGILCVGLAYSCSAGTDSTGGLSGNTSSQGAGAGSSTGMIPNCDICTPEGYTACGPNGQPLDPVACPEGCSPGLGCTPCSAGSQLCVGNEVVRCDDDGQKTTVVETCDVSAGLVCEDGRCAGSCEVAAGKPSNVGCEFWAVDMDQVDAFNDPASAPWGVALSNVAESPANVTIEINTAAPGQPLALSTVTQLTVAPGSLEQVILPTREIDCGVMPNDYASPGTCLSSNAFRITSSSALVVYQFNVFENAFSNDASLLLPTNALGKVYRVIGWTAGHPAPLPIPIPGAEDILDRSAVTIIGTQPDTMVRVKPSWKIKGNPPIAATAAGGEIIVTIGPFDVLNLETDDATLSEASDPSVADLSGTAITATKPVAVFSGVETTSAPAHVVDIPTYSGWNSDDTCCLDHLEEQLFPLEALGSKYVVTRSPIRSTGSYKEPDVLRFVGAAEAANVTTNLPSPFDSFTLQPGEVKTTWAQEDVIVEADKPILVGQILISQQYVDGPNTGDPALTIMPPVDQYRQEYVILTPGSWTTNWVVFAAPASANITIDAAAPTGCVVTAIGAVEGVDYESRRCPVSEGVHKISGDEPFGIIAYGYGNAGSYAFAGGADVKPIYVPPPLN